MAGETWEQRVEDIGQKVMRVSQQAAVRKERA
jgi:hypothetical protein